MAARFLKRLWTITRTVNPRGVERLASKPFMIGLLAAHESACEHMMRFLIPSSLSEQKAREASQCILRIAEPADFDRCDFGLAESHLDSVPHFYPFDPNDPSRAVDQFLDSHEDLWVPVARRFVGFRQAVAHRLIFKVAKENAAFAVASALPNIAPLLFELPWAVGEFASDMVILTMNQVRLAFLLAATNDAPVGFTEQKGQIGSIVGSAFGWRAIARELVSKVPFGAGLLPKGLIAFSGTYVVGLGLERYLRNEPGLTAEEKRELYARAHEEGRSVVVPLVSRETARAAG